MIDVGLLFYFVTFLAHCASVSCIINEMNVIPPLLTNVSALPVET